MRGGCNSIRQSDGPVLDRPVFFMAMDGRYAGAIFGDATDGRYRQCSSRLRAHRLNAA